jgi:hypothetical protein
MLQYRCTSRAAWKTSKPLQTDFRKAFPDLNFWGVADNRRRDYVVGRWEGGGTHTDPRSAFWIDCRTAAAEDAFSAVTVLV